MFVVIRNNEEARIFEDINKCLSYVGDNKKCVYDEFNEVEKADRYIKQNTGFFLDSSYKSKEKDCNTMVTYECEVGQITYPTAAERNSRKSKSEQIWTCFKVSAGKMLYGYKKFVNCAGMCPYLEVGDKVVLSGYFEDSKYGLQFKIQGVQKIIPQTREGIIKFFIDNINGIGEKTAKKIIELLGDDAVEKIEKDYTILETVEGISKNKASKIYEQLVTLHSSIEELKFFASTGLGTARIALVKEAYKDKAVEDLIAFIKTNPYQLVEDVKGIAFKIADSVALKIGIGRTDPNRLKAGIKQYLKDETEGKGNIWTSCEDIISNASGHDYLNVDPEVLKPILDQMITEEELKIEDGRIYLLSNYNLEKSIAEKMALMLKFECEDYDSKKIIKGINDAERVKERYLGEEQREAVKTSILNNISIITGGPGTGKTTTLDILLYYLEKNGMKITCCAPTGRAAKRMTEQTGRPASTIHSLHIKKTSNDFIRQCIVVDETSMVDIFTLNMVMKLCDKSTKLIFVGDVDQLPSIGPGQVLKDMINSERIPTTRLTKIYRQAEESAIIYNAHEIISGHTSKMICKEDFKVFEPGTEELCLEKIKECVLKEYPSNGVKSEEIQLLAPVKKGMLGVTNLNTIMQDLLNPADCTKLEYEIKNYKDGTSSVLREGDKVIQTKNDYTIECNDETKGVFNGEIGKILTVVNDFGEIYIRVDYGERIATYDKGQLKNLQLAYCITIHKSQGSEFNTVIVPCFSKGINTIYNRNLLYTAVTRAKQNCCLVGQYDTIKYMVHNNQTIKRRTTLDQMIKTTL